MGMFSFQFKLQSIIRPRYLTYVVCSTGLPEIFKLIVRGFLCGGQKVTKFVLTVLSISKDNLLSLYQRQDQDLNIKEKY